MIDVETIVAYEEGELDESDEIRMLQSMINAGQWGLQGSYGRAMMDCIEAGACVLGPEGHRDYWGNYVPSRTEVQPGTMGSVEYARDRGFEVLE